MKVEIIEKSHPCTANSSLSLATSAGVQIVTQRLFFRIRLNFSSVPDKRDSMGGDSFIDALPSENCSMELQSVVASTPCDRRVLGEALGNLIFKFHFVITIIRI